MKRIDIVKIPFLHIQEVPFPYGTIYGKDKHGIYAIIDKKTYNSDCGIMLYQWSEINGWTLLFDDSERAKTIVRMAKERGYWNIPIRMPKPEPKRPREPKRFEGLHEIASERHVAFKKCHAIKQGSSYAQRQRENCDMIPLDYVEKIIGHCL